MNESTRKGKSEPKEEERVEIKVIDDRGDHKVQVLPKRKIMKKLMEIDDHLEAYMKMIWEEHDLGDDDIDAVDTDAVLNLTTGKVDYYHRLPSSTEFPFRAAIRLFTIPQNIEEKISPWYLLDKEEVEEAVKMIKSHEIEELDEYPKEKGIDLSDRYARILTKNVGVFDLGWYLWEHVNLINKIYLSGIDRRKK